jgi:hypothetical protein
MSADSALTVPMQRRRISALGPFVGRVQTDPVSALAARMRHACVAAVDVDEVAAILEANGINDRVAARDYGAPTVFALAGRVVARTYDEAPTLVEQAPSLDRPNRRRLVVDTLVRAAIYVTPLGLGFAAGSEVDGVVTGTLMVGWGAGQALAYLGYRTRAERGAGAAARLLGGGFLVLTTAWCAVLALAIGLAPRGLTVAVAQLALFAVGAVALVTERERIVLAWTVPCWLSALAVAAGLGQPATVALLIALALLTAAAFRPALTGRPFRVSRADLGKAALFGAVGSGQAALLVVVVFGGTAGLVPPLIGVPLIELTLVWHQHRVAAARAVLSDRAAFDRRLGQISAATTALLALPVLAGAGIAAAVWAGAHPPGGQRLATAILLTAVYAICLVLAAHRRIGTAATLVWWPVLLVGGVGSWAPALLHVVPRFADTLAAATLLGAGLPGLMVAALVLRDPESYR